jgi:hypothetical protein
MERGVPEGSCTLSRVPNGMCTAPAQGASAILANAVPPQGVYNHQGVPEVSGPPPVYNHQGVPASQSQSHLANIMLHRTHDGQYILYSKHPSSERKSWPTETNVWCWHCCAPFETQPIPIPSAYDQVRNIYAVYGIFCSFSCAAKFLEVNRFADAPYQRRLLARMAREVFDNREPIKNAPDRWRRVEFGGDLSIDDFRSHHQTCRTYIRMPPFVMQAVMIEEHLLEPPQDAHLQSSIRDVSMQDVQNIDGHENRGQYEEYLQRQQIVIDKTTPQKKPPQRKIELPPRKPTTRKAKPLGTPGSLRPSSSGRKQIADAGTFNVGSEGAGAPTSRTKGTLLGYVKYPNPK